jgi:hypothetical protein
MLTSLRRLSKNCVSILCPIAVWLLVPPLSGYAQMWSWTTGQIDSEGSAASIVVDKDENVHVSYQFATGGQLRYAFRPSHSTSWFKMALDNSIGDFESQITVDSRDNPHICYSPRELKYAHFDGKRWSVQEIDKGGGLVSYMCSIRVGADDAPHISWYVESGVFLRYAELKDGVWKAITLDFEGLPGKWNSLALDPQGNPRISYIDFPLGQLRYAAFDGKKWSRLILDTPGATAGDNWERGFGNSIVLDSQGAPIIAYYDETSLKLAHYVDGMWKKQVIEQLPPFGKWSWKNFRSTLLLDSKGNPHIGFESLRGLEHAWWDGKQWHTQLILAARGATFFESSMAIDQNDNLYLVYRDPADGSLILASGSEGSAQQSMKIEK